MNGALGFVIPLVMLLVFSVWSRKIREARKAGRADSDWRRETLGKVPPPGAEPVDLTSKAKGHL